MARVYANELISHMYETAVLQPWMWYRLWFRDLYEQWCWTGDSWYEDWLAWIRRRQVVMHSPASSHQRGWLACCRATLTALPSQMDLHTVQAKFCITIIRCLRAICSSRVFAVFALFVFINLNSLPEKSHWHLFIWIQCHCHQTMNHELCRIPCLCDIRLYFKLHFLGIFRLDPSIPHTSLIICCN